MEAFVSKREDDEDQDILIMIKASLGIQTYKKDIGRLVI